jgi:CHAT domain-containing protein/tetratricopeptide (TPR) repeat protein
MALVVSALAHSTPVAAQVSGANPSAAIAPGDAEAYGRGAELNARGVDAMARGQHDAAEHYWMDALGQFERAGTRAEQANVLRNLAFLPRIDPRDERAILDSALALVLPTRDLHIEGQVRAKLADLEFKVGDPAASWTQVELATQLFERALAGSPGDTRTNKALARALTSRGRLQRLFGRRAEANADHLRAAEMLEQIGDWTGASQAYHGLAATLLFDGRNDEALVPFNRAIALARVGGDRGRLGAVLGQTAIVLQRVGRGPEAMRLLTEADGLIPDESRSTVDASWAEVLLGADRLPEALGRIDRALAAGGSVDSSIVWHWLRARILDRLGRPADALESSAKAVDMVEAIRPRLVPADDAKRGFAAVRGMTLIDHVARLAGAGRMEDALEASERARGRAFLDLLATTDLRPFVPEGPRAQTTPVEALERTTSGPAAPPRGLDLWLQTRGAAAGPRRPVAPEPDISSVAMAEPLTLSSIKAQATRLGTHIVAYWVMPRQTLAWIVAPNGRTTSVKVDVTEQRLQWLSLRAATTSAAGPTRGEARAKFGGDAGQANRELYRLLIAPLRAALPPSGSLLTIVPNGPLFRLPFAAFAAPSGRYLIEDYPLHYASSISALAFTARGPSRRHGPALVVADPAMARSVAQADGLERLPGAAREGRLVARALGPDTTQLLQSSAATERGFRDGAAAARVIHLATHAVVRDDRPFESFLVMAAAGSEPENDGRLMMGEIYGLRLDAALVVLSACKSASGPVTGDGIVALSRGFFAAGAPSVMASLWDLPDAVTVSVFPSFYAAWSEGTSRAESLRQAQLALIRDLRAGRVQVDTPAGRFTLPEHPSLWAGLVLLGEP